MVFGHTSVAINLPLLWTIPCEVVQTIAVLALFTLLFKSHSLVVFNIYSRSIRWLLIKTTIISHYQSLSSDILTMTYLTMTYMKLTYLTMTYLTLKSSVIHICLQIQQCRYENEPDKLGLTLHSVPQHT